MRFDDRIATALAAPAASDAARIARWRQIVDLVAQAADDDHDVWLDAAYAALDAGRDAVAIEVRRQAAAALQGRRVAPRLVAFFAADHPSVAAPLIATVRLGAGEWVALLPRLSPTARLLLRNRRDLAPAVRQGLEAFGASDLALSGTVASPDDSEIRDLVARIEAFQKARPTAPPAADPSGVEPATAFRWESGPDGVIAWVDGAPRGPIVGQSIAAVSDVAHQGVDGQAAGAFDKRSPFRDARFRVAGEGPAGGDWRISGVPAFDRATGAFTGYRGDARRPRIDQVAPAVEAQPGLFGTALPIDSLRQLVHELRTPLNAIAGFAEMIDGQYIGPAARAYRDRAADIRLQAGRLMSAIDDLDTAARLEGQRHEALAEPVDLAAMLGRVTDAHRSAAAEEGVGLAVAIDPALPAASVDPGLAERMIGRLLSATIGLASAGETIAVGLRAGERAQSLCITLARPRAIGATDERSLLDPGYSPDGDWPSAPALGLGFALRLVRSLAEASGGRLVIETQAFGLYLPAKAAPGQPIEAEV